MKRIDYSELASGKTVRAINNRIDDILQDYSIDDPPYLSDVLTFFQHGASHMAFRLGQEWKSRGGKKYRWKIKVLCDEFGRPPKEGDVIKRKVTKETEEGQLRGAGIMNLSKQAGTYEEDFYNFIEFPVDAKGCIECEFDDAAAFLNTHGIHGRSGKPLPMNTHRPTSEEPVKTDAGHFHVHYWRYQEVDNEQYEALPYLADKEETKPAPRGKLSKGKKD